MSTERKQVLDMVASGSVTVEQAEQLMQALDKLDAPAAAPRALQPSDTPQTMPKLTFEQLVALGKYGIPPGYVRELREAGCTDLTFDQVIRLGKYGISPEYVKEMSKELGEGLTWAMPSDEDECG